MAAKTSLATAYVQIVPTTKGIKNNISEELEGQVGDGGKKAGTSLGKQLIKAFAASKAVETVTNMVKSAANAAVDLTKIAVGGAADLQQSIGGIETLYKESADTMIKYANQAYKTAGMSANDYMETTTSFAASMLTSVGGNAAEAAELSNKAVIAMSDNANKMGTDMQDIQNAYQGFAKQNYTMLDNLKLGKTCYCRVA